MDFADLKRQARQAVHDTFAVPAVYADSSWPGGIGVNVRWHNRLIRQGNLGAAGYSEVFEGVNRLVFGAAELTTLGLTPAQGGIVTIAAYGGARFSLDTRETSDGPVDVIWNVVKDEP